MFTWTLRNIKQARQAVKRCLQSFKRCRLVGPVLVTGGMDSPETARHIAEAQMGHGSSVQRGHAPMLLNYKNKPDRPRKRALRPYKRSGQVCEASDLNNFCDEYPFFKTVQGAPRNLPGKVSLKIVPAAEQRIQGGLFNAMVGACRLRTGPPSRRRFLAVSIPNDNFFSGFLCLK